MIHSEKKSLGEMNLNKKNNSKSKNQNNANSHISDFQLFSFKLLFIIILVGLFFLNYDLLKIFITPFLLSVILTFFFYPIYKFMNKKLHKKISAFFSTVFAFLVLIVPFCLIVFQLFNELKNLFLSFERYFYLDYVNICKNNVLCSKVFDSFLLSDNLIFSKVYDNVLAFLEKAVMYLFSTITGFLFSIPRIVFIIIFTLIFTYLLLLYGKELVLKSASKIPLRKSFLEKSLKEYNHLIYSICYGVFLTAIVQGFCAFIIYFLLGLKSVFFLTILTTIAALFPFLGTGFVWVPIFLYLLITGILTQNHILIIKAVILFVYSIIVVINADEVFRTFIISKYAKVHFLIILLGVVGGTVAFGFLGIFFGPILLYSLIFLIKNIFTYHEKKDDIALDEK